MYYISEKDYQPEFAFSYDNIYYIFVLSNDFFPAALPESYQLSVGSTSQIIIMLC
jgi:hypothetical protein